MIDINKIRENPDEIKKAVADKQLDESVVDKLLTVDKKRRELITQVEELRKRKNLAAKETNIEEGKKIKLDLKAIEPELKQIEEEFNSLVNQIPNPAAADVKVGKNDTENEIIRTWGEPWKFDFKPKNHWELGESLGIIDTDRASKVSGSRFFYLLGDGVLLDQAMVQYGRDLLLKENFIPVIPPMLIKKESMKAMGYMEHGGEEDMFVLDKDGLVLVGTSEQSIGPMHMNEILKGSDLPKRYVGYSTCFRREAGSYGQDTKGAFRVHQFNKLEMFVFTKPEDGDKEHEFMLSLEEKLLQGLGIPYEVSKMVTGDLGLPAARKYDLNGWFPGQEKYRELTSTSTTTDFQSRRLNTKYQEKGETNFVHMLNGTVFSQRPILAILENYQQKDGSVLVPEVLQKYMGKEKITPQK